MESQDPTKVRLLEAAGEEFADKGFAVARVRDICVRAGANGAGVNYHFGDKERLYVEAVLSAHHCGVGLELPTNDEATPAEQLRAFVHGFLSRVLALGEPQDWRHRLMLRELMQPTPASDVLVREVVRPKFERLLEILGRFLPDASERTLHAVAFSVIGQCLHYQMGRPVAERLIGVEMLEALDLEFLTDHITSFSVSALESMERKRARPAPQVEEAGSLV